MITANVLKVKEVSHEDSWQRVLANAIRDPQELLSLLGLDQVEDKEKATKLLHHPERFKLLVPLSYVAKMKRGDWNDPLLKQVLPVQDETKSVAGFIEDPVGDLDSIITSGVLKKYNGRVLLITTGACAVHCRYCFRRHFPYANSMPDKSKWQETLESIRSDETIHEVILSGGDPLMIPDERLKAMCEDLASIPHVKTLRFHTRVPVFLPERIDFNFKSWLSKLAVKKVMVIHANHVNELDQIVGDALNELHEAGVMLLNQSVLLKGINDKVSDLVGLSHRLFEFNVLPYYIHQLDRVHGSAHFEVDREDSLNIVNEMKYELPGYLVPKLVEEVSGERSKRALE